jgi:WD40 repeat protein
MQTAFLSRFFCRLRSTYSSLTTQILFMQIYVWSMKTGRLLDVLSGHQGPVHGLMFSPISVSLCFALFFPNSC